MSYLGAVALSAKADEVFIDLYEMRNHMGEISTVLDTLAHEVNKSPYHTDFVEFHLAFSKVVLVAGRKSIISQYDTVAAIAYYLFVKSDKRLNTFRVEIQNGRLKACHVKAPSLTQRVIDCFRL